MQLDCNLHNYADCRSRAERGVFSHAERELLCRAERGVPGQIFVGNSFPVVCIPQCIYIYIIVVFFELIVVRILQCMGAGEVLR